MQTNKLSDVFFKPFACLNETLLPPEQHGPLSKPSNARAYVIAIIVIPIFDLYKALSHTKDVIIKILPAIVLPIIEIPLYLFGVGINYDNCNLSAVAAHAIKTILYTTFIGASPLLGIASPNLVLLIHRVLDLDENQVLEYNFNKDLNTIAALSERAIQQMDDALKEIKKTSSLEALNLHKEKLENIQEETKEKIKEFKSLYKDHFDGSFKSDIEPESHLRSIENQMVNKWISAMRRKNEMLFERIEQKKLQELEKAKCKVESKKPTTITVEEKPTRWKTVTDILFHFIENYRG